MNTRLRQRPHYQESLAGLATKVSLSLTLGAAALASPAAWAGSWNASQEMLNNHGTWIYTPTATLTGGKRALVIALHGCDQTNTQLKDWGNIHLAAESQAAVFALPYVGATVWPGNPGAKCWDYDNAADGSRHMAELIALTRTLKGRAALNIDPNHVYVIGLSAGAAVALDVACKAPDLYAGVAAQAGPATGSPQSSALTDAGGILYTAASAATKCNALADASGVRSSLATQTALIAYGDKDKNAESPGCTYTSGSTTCPGTYQLVSKKWSTINVDAYRSIYGAGALGAASNVIDSLGRSVGSMQVANAGGVPRLAFTRIFGVGHAWPAGGTDGNDATHGGVWMHHGGMAYADYAVRWLKDTNLRGGSGSGAAPVVTLSAAAGSATTVNFSGNATDSDGTIGSLRAQLYAWNTTTRAYAASGSPLARTVGVGGAYSGSFTVPTNNWYQVTVTATDNDGRTTSRTVSDIAVGSPPPRTTCRSVTSTNPTHLSAGRAHLAPTPLELDANGSNQRLPGYNLSFYSSTLSETSSGFWIVGPCPGS